MENLGDLIRTLSMEERRIQSLKRVAALTHRFSEIELRCTSCRDRVAREHLSGAAAKAESRSSIVVLASDLGLPVRDSDQTETPADTPRARLCTKLFRRIALSVHPDKQPDDPRLFPIANAANARGELGALVFVAERAGVAVPMTRPEAELVEEEADLIERKISKLKGCVFYDWDSLSPAQQQRAVDLMRELRSR